jgi:hypothetical protein
MELVYLCGTNSRFTYCPLFPLDQRSGLLTAHYVLIEVLQAQDCSFELQPTVGENIPGPFCGTGGKVN